MKMACKITTLGTAFFLLVGAASMLPAETDGAETGKDTLDPLRLLVGVGCWTNDIALEAAGDNLNLILFADFRINILPFLTVGTSASVNALAMDYDAYSESYASTYFTSFGIEPGILFVVWRHDEERQRMVI
jgi:hypothetical protein